ncbi:MAG: sigma-54-dependent transcriptional regulator [Planctomycetota bacterium]
MTEIETQTPAVPPPPRGARLLVVEDDPLVSAAVCLGLEGSGHVVECAPSAASARRASESNPPDLVLLDAVLPDAEPAQLLRELARSQSGVPIVVMTAYPTVDGAIAAHRDGAWAYLPKPFPLSALTALVAEALDATQLWRARAAAQRDAAAQRHASAILTQCPAMRDVLDLAERAAAHPGTTILIDGESGAGKGLLARCIHDWSPRRAAPFVEVNCSAIPDQLLESEFFGHARGAFTGAVAVREGLVAEAAGGTLFLDEIGEVPAALQAKLLRWIETRRYRPVGASVERSSDVRIVAATNCDLAAAVETGAFREDLYYRLCVFPIRMPPLRDRGDDIPLLLQQFLERLDCSDDPARRGFTPDAIERLVQHRWPGNVRELRNVVERALIVARAAEIGVEDLPPDIRGGAGGADAPWRFVLPEAGTDVRAVEQDFLIQALRRTHGNRTEAARLLGLTRDGVRYRVKNLTVDWRAPAPPSSA